MAFDILVTPVCHRLLEIKKQLDSDKIASVYFMKPLIIDQLKLLFLVSV